MSDSRISLIHPGCGWSRRFYDQHKDNDKGVKFCSTTGGTVNGEKLPTCDPAFTSVAEGFPTTLRCDASGSNCEIDFVGYRDRIPE